MIILAYGSGGHSNRLIQNIHFEAFCKEHGIEYINPSFFNMHKYYVNPCKLLKGFKEILLMNSLYARIMRKLKRLNVVKNIVDVSFDNPKDNSTDLLFTTNDIYVGGWYFRVYDLTEKYHDYFIDKYSLKRKFYENNALFNIITESQKNSKIVIGVHIRWGDYRYWEEGRWFFSADIYMKYMENIEAEVERECNKKSVFIIFSNEDVPIIENENVYKSKNEWYIDHLLMSKCDLLIGPPSTFAAWASYIGKVKFFEIVNSSGEICLNDFIYCKV